MFAVDFPILSLALDTAIPHAFALCTHLCRSRFIADPTIHFKMKRVFPTKSELDALANAEDWETLKKRAKECTPKNMIAAAFERRKESGERMLFPIEIFRKIAFFMDIRQVLELGNTNIMFQSFLASDDFWAKKMAIDFPEVLFFLNKTRFVLNASHRNLYNVVRYFMINDVYRLLCLRRNITGGPSDGMYFKFEFNRKKCCFTRNVFVSTVLSPKGIQVGDAVDLSIDQMITRHVGDRIEYLTGLGSTFTDCVERPGAYFCLNGDNLTFSQLVERGYVRMRDNKIVIG